MLNLLGLNKKIIFFPPTSMTFMEPTLAPEPPLSSAVTSPLSKVFDSAVGKKTPSRVNDSVPRLDPETESLYFQESRKKNLPWDPIDFGFARRSKHTKRTKACSHKKKTFRIPKVPKIPKVRKQCHFEERNCCCCRPCPLPDRPFLLFDQAC